MPPPNLVGVEEEEGYVSSEDSDFAPDDAPDNASSAASDNDDDDDDEDEAAGGAKATAHKRKRETGEAVEAEGTGIGNGSVGRKAQAEPEAEDAGFENSGDEAIIGKGKKRLKRDKATVAGGGDGDEETGPGGFVKTRSQRAQEKAERRTAVVQGPVTVNVDDLWAQMMGSASGNKGLPQTQTQMQTQLASLDTAAFAVAAGSGSEAATPAAAETETKGRSDDTGMVKIRRTYNFAGKVHTEEKLVVRDSAEAKLYLASLEGQKDNGAGNDNDNVGAGDGEVEAPKRPPPRKAFRSAFEPALDPSLLASLGAGAGGRGRRGRRADLDLGLHLRLEARERAAAAAAQQNAKKLNTVEKSRMDWAGYVDKEGIKDELELAGKSKDSFAERQQFLARSEARREEETRRARLAGKV